MPQYVISRDKLADHPFDLRLQDFSGGRQLHAMGTTVEDRSLQFVFQLGDLPADRRRRYVQPLGRGSDGTRIGCLAKIAQCGEVHASAPQFEEPRSSKIAVEADLP